MNNVFLDEDHLFHFTRDTYTQLYSFLESCDLCPYWNEEDIYDFVLSLLPLKYSDSVNAVLEIEDGDQRFWFIRVQLNRTGSKQSVAILENQKTKYPIYNSITQYCVAFGLNILGVRTEALFFDSAPDHSKVANYPHHFHTLVPSKGKAMPYSGLVKDMGAILSEYLSVLRR